MARILYYTTHGTDDPTRAGLAFIGANGATQAGHDPVIALLGDATFLMKGDIPSTVTPVGFPPLSEHLATAIGNGTQIRVWGGWARARGVTDQDLVGKNASFITPADFANLVVEVDRVVAF